MYTFQARAVVNGRGWECVFQASDILDAMDYVDTLLADQDYSAVEIAGL
jgi:hypothetical protein